MKEELLRLLNTGGVCPRGDNIKRGNAFGVAPVAAKKTNTLNPLAPGLLDAVRTTLRDLPLVVNAISTSPFSPNPQTCRAKISSAL